MRIPAWPIALALLLAGCVTAPIEDLDDIVEAEGAFSDDSVRLMEWYGGAVVSANAGVLQMSPDQAGEIHREMYVHEGTLRLVLHLETSGGDLDMYVAPPGCSYADPCAERVPTENGKAMHEVGEPEAGSWMTYFFKRDPGAGEITYDLHIEKIQVERHAVEHEVYEGKVTAAHLGAIRISPDQLGDVYREFWVHEGTRVLTVDFESDTPAYFVIGQSDRGRDRESEEGFDTEDNKVSLVYEDPVPGGWYFILFHPSEGGPNVKDIRYTVDVAKSLDAPEVQDVDDVEMSDVGA